jgi:hypothetical protein
MLMRECATLYNNLVEDETTFHDYFRLSQCAISSLLQRYRTVHKSKVHLEESTTPKQRLETGLKYENKNYLLEENAYFEKL